jgi:flagellar biogenesis protein FliO
MTIISSRKVERLFQKPAAPERTSVGSLSSSLDGFSKTLVLLQKSSLTILITLIFSLCLFRLDALGVTKTDLANEKAPSSSVSTDIETNDKSGSEIAAEQLLNATKAEIEPQKTGQSTKKNASGTLGTEQVKKPVSKNKTTVTTEALLNLGYDDPGEQKKDSSFFGGLLSGIASVVWYVLSIVLVLAIGIFAIYGIKLFSTKYGNFAGSGSDLLSVLEVKHIAPGKAVCLVEVAEKVLVLSMTSNNINYLAEVTDRDKVEELKTAAEQKKTEPMQPFQIVLDKITNRGTLKKTRKDSTSLSVDKKISPQRAQATSEWQDDLNSTGENIKKLLDDIANQNKPVKRNRPSSKQGRGGERK